MRPAARLLAFGIVLAAVGGGAAALGALAGSGEDAPAPSPHAPGGHGHEAPQAAHEPAAGGLARAEDGYVLVPERTRLAAGESERLAFRIEGPDGRTVRSFETEHERRMHLILVRRDLSGFQHLHPEMDAEGTFSVPVRLPTAGVWRLFADFRTGGRSLTLGHDLMAAGAFAPEPLAPPADEVAAGDYVVRLVGGRDAAGTPTELAFEVSRDGRRVEDIEPYLGARGHLVALREGDLAFLHVHPLDEARRGGSIRFRAEFPSAGRYRLFLQFAHRGAVHTAAFTREVAR